MKPIPRLLLIAAILAGCASPRSVAPQQSASSAPDAPVKSASPTPVTPEGPAPAAPVIEPVVDTREEILPGVPLPSGTAAHNCVSTDRCFAQIQGGQATTLSEWYTSTLVERGWKPEPLSLASTTVLLFSKDGAYLSLSVRQSDPSVVVWFHRRATPQVTQAEAVQVASETHRLDDPTNWVARFVPDFDSERYGAGVTDPVWEVEARFPRSSVTVWVDTITAEPFRIRQSDDF